MGFIINPYQVQPSGPSYGTLTTAWITATGETDTTILGALNTLESDLSTYGLTSKIKALYPMVGGTSTKHSYNFMNTAAFQISFSGGWTHASTGATPNGTNAYGNTGLIFSSELSLTSAHLSYYSRTENTSAVAEIGVIVTTGGKQSYAMFNYGAGSRYVAINNSGANTGILPSSTKGLILDSRVDGSYIKSYYNGSLLSNYSRVTDGIPNINTYIGAINYDGTPSFYTTKECALASIGDGLTDTEAANFYTAVQAFNTTLNRQV